MSFLQPMLLAALPLVALPIIIHLINQRRYQTVRWAAMMFLLAANRMSRGYARLRQWLIMAFRMRRSPALIFAVSRPLAGGWLGLAGGRPGRHDDRPARPLAQHAAGRRRRRRLEAGDRAAGSSSQTLETLGSARWVLIDSATNQPARAGVGRRPARRRPAPGPSSASADIPAMLQAARDYIKANKAGPHRDLDLLRPPRERLERRRAAAGRRSATRSSSSRRASGSTCWPIPRRPPATCRCG